MDATNVYGHSRCQMLPYDEIEVWYGHSDLYMNKLEELLKTPDEIDIGYFIDVDLKYSDMKKGKTKKFPFCPENKIIDKDKYIKYINKKT